MKKTLLIASMAVLAYACQKKEDPKPTIDANFRNEETAIIDTNAGKVKVTTWSNRAGYTYKRNQYRKGWKETTVTTKTAVFYEDYCDCEEEGNFNFTEYAMFASHNLSGRRGDSIRITIEYKKLKATNLNVLGTYFAITHMIDMK